MVDAVIFTDQSEVSWNPDISCCPVWRRRGRSLTGVQPPVQSYCFLFHGEVFDLWTCCDWPWPTVMMGSQRPAGDNKQDRLPDVLQPPLLWQWHRKKNIPTVRGPEHINTNEMYPCVAVCHFKISLVTLRCKKIPEKSPNGWFFISDETAMNYWLRWTEFWQQFPKMKGTFDSSEWWKTRNKHQIVLQMWSHLG